MPIAAGGAVVLEAVDLDRLLRALQADGRTLVGPTVRDGAITYAEITSVAELPRGVGEQQDAGGYRLVQRQDDLLFGFASTAQSWKPWLFPARQALWRSRRGPDGIAVAPEPAQPRPLALLGVRGCDLAAIAVHDRVLGNSAGTRPAADPHYRAARSDVLLVAVTCAVPGGTCFCTSMGTGPRPGAGADLLLTELADGRGHRFLVEVQTERGDAVLASGEVPLRPADAADLQGAESVVETATVRMGRFLDRDGLRDLLVAEVENPRWDDVASRCLTCMNCTLVCPTCFCSAVEDHTDLAGGTVERLRVWDSCFGAEFSHLHGGSVRASSRSRYRQWLTHKLGVWGDQFGTSGCVGCGRCITWCPVGIDLTAEVAALRESARAATGTED